ncbi:hypothetical protein CQW23_10980 [Capsicum baccatum]|uniref:Uncharacterized protein n=1 Tax=Capsicum baccatum TaxID=33114 RepID=A0A2G2X197_CAPBA|nr:hypothetical protein CQW23_10980 [Capsicum baccatum]
MVHFPTWVVPIVVAAVAIACRIPGRTAFLTVIFLYNVIVGGQFSTSAGEKLPLASWALTAAFAIVITTVSDTYLSMKNYMIMQGRRMLIRRRNNQLILAESNQNWFEKYLLERLRIAFRTIRQGSRDDRVRIAASVTVLLLPAAELVSRCLCKVNICNILQTVYQQSRLFSRFFVCQRESSENLIHRKIECLLFVGNFQRQSVDFPDPSSNLWRGCRARPQMIVRVTRTFDIWSTAFRATSRETMHFTMMELRQPTASNANNTPWYFPAADFVILHFSALNRQSYNAVRAMWNNPDDSLERHIKNSRVILVGTDTAERDAGNLNHVTVLQGYQLAYYANAVTYLEIREYGDVGNLFVEIIKLTH